MNNNLGNKKTMSKNIQYYMNINNKTRQDICNDLKIKYTTFTDWVNGNSYPRIDKIELIANYFGVEKSDLIEEHNTKPKLKGIKIPVLGRVQAGIPIEAIEEVIDEEEITEDLAKTGEFFGLQIKGNSMEPRICEGDVVIVRQQPDVESGEIAVVLVNGDDATIKKVKKTENGIMLIPTNPNYEPLFFDKKQIEELPVIILGKVIELRAKF